VVFRIRLRMLIFYEPKKSSDFYGESIDKEYDPFVDVDVKNLTNVEEERQGVDRCWKLRV